MTFLFRRRFLSFFYVSIVFFQSFSIVESPAPDTPSAGDTTFCTPMMRIKNSAYRSNAYRAKSGVAYTYDPASPKIVTEVPIDKVNITTKFNADHVFEAQILSQFFGMLKDNNDIQRICQAIFVQDNGEEVRTIMNHPDNMIWLDSSVNVRKGSIFGGNNVLDPNLYFAVMNYLRHQVVYTSFVVTRNKLIDYFCEIANSLKPPITIDIGIMLGDASSSQYTRVTGYLLPPSRSCKEPQKDPEVVAEAEIVKIWAIEQQQQAKMVVKVIYLSDSTIKVKGPSSTHSMEYLIMVHKNYLICLIQVDDVAVGALRSPSFIDNGFRQGSLDAIFFFHYVIDISK